MRMSTLVLFFCLSTALGSHAQDVIVNDKAQFVIRPLFFADFNVYHWYQQPYVQFDGRTENVGQTLNLIPGIGTGFVMGKKTTALLVVEAGIKYMPFSLDVAEYDGIGALSFPVLASMRFPIKRAMFLQVGAGIQWSRINLFQPKDAPRSAYFATYVGELSIGVEEAAYLLYFTRIGYHPNGATTIDLGIRMGIHGSLWE